MFCFSSLFISQVILTAAATKVRSTASLLGFIALVAINPSESELLKAVAYIVKTQLFCKYNLMLSQFVSSRLANKCSTYRISFRNINPQHSLYYLCGCNTGPNYRASMSFQSPKNCFFCGDTQSTYDSALLSQH